MCGIVGYVGKRQALPVLQEGIKRLEYRGYDSAGFVTIGDGLELFKDKGDVSSIVSNCPDLAGTTGLGHTRWATHGKPARENAHPFIGCQERFAVVHNGIIENHATLRAHLIEAGHTFSSETDTEVLVHLLEEKWTGDLLATVQVVVAELEGAYAIAVIAKDAPLEVVGSRRESPLLIGIGAEETFLASDVTAVLKWTNQVAYLHDGDFVRIRPGHHEVWDDNGVSVTRPIEEVNWDLADAEKGGYTHFMLKEIHEIPKAIHETILGRLDGEPLAPLPAGTASIKLVACGTSMHACMLGRQVIERLARIPCSVETASEYRYGGHPRGHPLVIFISQSGETTDTLAALKEAHRRGCPTLGITNVVGSSITRLADQYLLTRAGPEIGVAATKTHVTQLTVLYLLAIEWARSRREVSESQVQELLRGIRDLPRVVERVLADTPRIAGVARRFSAATSSFFIGRGLYHGIALEGALKLKEISYIHAEGFPAGELKHGPLALLTPETPVVALALKGPHYAKVVSNIRECIARDSPLIAVVTTGDQDLPGMVDVVIEIPETDPLFAPIPVVVALFLLAYIVARERGCEIDKPRNLAKSVTVE